MDKFMSRSAAAGTRAIPQRGSTDDTKIGLRLDYGEIVDRNGKKMRHVKMQPNKGADDRAIREKVARNSHQVLAEAFVDLDNPDKNAAGEQMFVDLEDDALCKEDEEEAKKQSKKDGKKGGKK